MQIVNTVATKLGVALVAVAMLFSVAMPAQAQTMEELQAQIAALMAQIAALSGGSSSSSAACTFTGSLTIGAQGASVTCLQNYLIGAGFSIPAGATGYFGTQTQAAVAAWQAANGVAPAVGYFGPISQAKYAAVAGTGTGTGTGTGSSDLKGGAGSLDDADFISSINNEEVGEDQEDVEVLGLELEADNNSDLRLTSVRVEFEQQTAAKNDDFDDYADEVTIWLDGDKVGSVDVDDMNESSDLWSATVALDSDAVIRMGDTGELVVAVTALSNIDGTDLGSTNNDWEVAVSNVRYVDATGAVINESSLGDIGSTDVRSFYFDTFASANDVELTVSESSDNPDAGTVEVDDDGGTEVTLLVGELEAEGSDLEITSLMASTTPTGASVEEMVARFILVIDGDEVDSVDADECTDTTNDCSNDDGQSAAYIFNDFEFMLDEGDTVDFEIRAELLEFAGSFGQGDSLEVFVDADDIDAEDEAGDDLSANELKGSATGEEQTFASTGLTVKLTSSSASQVLGLDSTSADDQGKYVMEFEVTAFEDTAYIELDAASTTDAAGQDRGVAFSIEDTSNNTVAAGTNSAVLERISGGSLAANNTVRVNAGQTAKFRLTVYYDAATTGIYRVQMNQVGFAATAVAATTAQATTPEANFQSESVQVQH